MLRRDAEAQIQSLADRVVLLRDQPRLCKASFIRISLLHSSHTIPDT